MLTLQFKQKILCKLTFFTASLMVASSLMAQNALADMTSLGSDTYHFFDGGYGSLVVVGDDGVAVVDPASTERAMKLKQEVAKITSKKISHVILTHEHYDHVGGTEVFNDAEIVCQTSCQKFFDMDILGIAPDKVTMSFENYLDINLGNKEINLHHWGSGDGVATTIVHVPSAKTVSVADLYDGPRELTPGMWIEDKNSLGTMKILNRLSKWDLDHVISGHSNITDPKAMREHAEFHNDLYKAVKEQFDVAIEQGGIGATFELLSGSMPDTLKLPEYMSWKGYDEHLAKHIWRMGMSISHGG